MRSLILFHSLTGTTHKLALHLANECGADLFELQTRRYPRGVFGYLRAGFDAMRRKNYTITMPKDLSGYDALMIGGPVWIGGPSAPLRSFLMAAPALPPKLGVFLTSGGPPAGSAVQAISALLGRAPDATLELTQEQVQSDQIAAPARGFLEELGLVTPHPGG